MIDDPRFRIWQSQFFQVRELQRFRNLVVEAPVAVDHAHALAFEVRQIVERVEDAVAQAALPRRRTHAIEEQGMFLFRRVHVIVVMPRVNLQPRHATLVELLKQRSKPVRMLVINGNRLFEPVTVSVCLVTHETSHLALTLESPSWDEREPPDVPFYCLGNTSGRLRRAFLRAAPRRPLATSSWLPPVRISGT